MEFPVLHWDAAETITTVLVNISLVVAALFATVKFKLLPVFARRHKSGLVCHHFPLREGGVVFQARYTVINTGERPIDLTLVTLTLCEARTEGALVHPDRDKVLARRICKPSDTDKRGLFRILANERSIFTLRCQLEKLPEIVFMICQISRAEGQEAAAYTGMYVLRPSIQGATRAA